MPALIQLDSAFAKKQYMIAPSRFSVAVLMVVDSASQDITYAAGCKA